MLASKSPDELATLKELGLDKPVAWDLGIGSPRRFGDDDQDRNPADDVIDMTPVLSEPVRPDQLQIIADHFSRALVWASEAKTLIDMGWRLATMIAVMRPALLQGLDLEVRLELRRGLKRALADANPAEVGEHYRGQLEWCRKCSSISQLGMRGFAMLYVLRRDLLGSLGTNAAIAALQNKTRQAFNRVVQNYRDAHHGFRNGVMRSELTRTRCRIAQLKRRPRKAVVASGKVHPSLAGDRTFARPRHAPH